MSQSPQTGQVYFNGFSLKSIMQKADKSQSPQTGQVYFNSGLIPLDGVSFNWAVSIPSNGSSLFQ